jgi:serine/threonine-protein kinase
VGYIDPVTTPKNQTPGDEPSSPSPARPDEGPLSLADSSAGSRGPDAGASNAPDGSTDQSMADAEANSASPATTTSGGDTDQAGTGGFDTLLGQVVVRAGIATEEEVDRAFSDLSPGNSGSGGDLNRTLADALIERQYATKHQIDRLRSDFEARRSGRSIPGFRIKRKLGAGAMATVFLAKQISLDRLVAIKVLPKKYSSNKKFIERFYKEGRAAAQLNHANIVQAYDVGAAGEHHYFVMEYVDGPTVYDRIVGDKRMAEREAIDVVKQVAMALKHAHERGFIHRDIKPKNIMITRTGRVKLADLGLARALSDKDAAEAEAGRAYGTPYYISPEQIRGELKIGPQADIYGLGATFFHMVTGRVPFEGKNPSSVMHRHLKSQLEPPDHLNPELSAACAQVIEMMMAKKVEDRYQSVDDLIEDLDLIAQGKPPHFAHRSLDGFAIADTLTAEAQATASIATLQPDRSGGGGSATDSPMFMGLLILAVASVIANLILLVMVLG